MALMELSPILILSAAEDGANQKKRNPKQTKIMDFLLSRPNQRHLKF
jgi:hypothetical protein